jgi:YHS domain-containing protein
MKSNKFQLTTIALLLCLLCAGLVISGCKCGHKKSDKTAMMSMEQTTCPISGKAINKECSTVYKGKTVYFCCPNCKAAFEKEPEKYVGKLPQFNSGSMQPK